jgi:hypothetical protein
VADESYGAEAELERLLRCPECGSAAVKPVRQSVGAYGFFGFKALGDLGSPRLVHCSGCGAEWMRAPMRELRREAERRIDERYDRFEAENRRLQQELQKLVHQRLERDLEGQLLDGELLDGELGAEPGAVGSPPQHDPRSAPRPNPDPMRQRDT